MAKDFDIELLEKGNEKYSKTKKVTLGGFNLNLDTKFSPVKLDKMVEDFIETILTLYRVKARFNPERLMTFFILKHFAGMADAFDKNLNKKVIESGETTFDKILEVRAFCSLKQYENVYNAGLFPVFAMFDQREVQAAMGKLTQGVTRVEKELPKITEKVIESAEKFIADNKILVADEDAIS